jgi:hypothetical protein
LKGLLRNAVRKTKTAESVLIFNILGNLTEDVYTVHGPEKALRWIHFSELCIEIVFWKIALKKATDLSAGPQIFIELCPLLLLRTFTSICIVQSVQPTSCCDTLNRMLLRDKCLGRERECWLA